MHRFAAASEDQEQAHQTPVPIALEVETPKIDAALQLAVYLCLMKIGKGKTLVLHFPLFLVCLYKKLNRNLREIWISMKMVDCRFATKNQEKI